MLILDTDHVSEIDRQSAAGVQLLARLSTSDVHFGTTIVTVEEQMRGILAEIKGAKSEEDRIEWYDRLARKIETLATIRMLDWDRNSVAVFEGLRQQRIRIGTMDLRIASIAIANGAVLLTRNLKDFARVPGLRAENWIET